MNVGGGGGIYLPPGDYVLTYVSGAVSYAYSGLDGYTVRHSGVGGPQLLYNNEADFINWPDSPTRSLDTDVAADQVGVQIAFTHTGGTIGMVYVTDPDSPDNVPGPTVGPPVFRLSRVFGSGSDSGSDSGSSCPWVGAVAAIPEVLTIPFCKKDTGGNLLGSFDDLVINCPIDGQPTKRLRNVVIS